MGHKERDMKTKWKMIYVRLELPERREIKPIGRITLFGKELTAEQTKNYCKTISNKITS
jgi:hypothetical protein